MKNFNIICFFILLVTCSMAYSINQNLSDFSLISSYIENDNNFQSNKLDVNEKKANLRKANFINDLLTFSLEVNESVKLVANKGSHLWIYISDKGFYKKGKSNSTPAKNSKVTNNQILEMMTNNNGDLFFQDSKLNIYKISKNNSNQKYEISQQKTDGSVHSLAKDNKLDKIYWFTNSNSKPNATTYRKSNLSSLEMTRDTASYKMSVVNTSNTNTINNVFYYISSSKLYDSNDKISELSNFNANHLCTDKNYNLFVATSNGIYLKTKSKPNYIKVSDIVATHISCDDTLWIISDVSGHVLSANYKRDLENII